MSLTLTRAGKAGTGPAFNPNNVSGLIAAVQPALSRSQSKLWQDSGKTIPATANGDPVRVAVCPYTSLEFTAPSDAARPALFDEGSGKWSLSFDGVDDVLILTTAATLWTVWTGARYSGAIFAGFNGLFTGDIGATEWLIGDSGTTNFFATISSLSYFRRNGTESVSPPYLGPMSGVPAVIALGKSAGTTVSELRLGQDRNIANRFWSGRVAGAAAYSAAVSAPNRTSLDSFFTALY